MHTGPRKLYNMVGRVAVASMSDVGPGGRQVCRVFKRDLFSAVENKKTRAGY